RAGFPAGSRRTWGGQCGFSPWAPPTCLPGASIGPPTPPLRRRAPQRSRRGRGVHAVIGLGSETTSLHVGQLVHGQADLVVLAGGDRGAERQVGALALDDHPPRRHRARPVSARRKNTNAESRYLGRNAPRSAKVPIAVCNPPYIARTSVRATALDRS